MGKLMFLPISLGSGLLAGLIGKKAFELIWGVIDDEEAPKAQNRQTDRDKAETERDREVNARALADADYLAREIAALRIAIEHKADRDDISDAVRELTLVAERIGGGASDDDEPDEGFSGRTDDLSEPSG